VSPLPHLRFDISAEAASTVVRITGEIDAETASELLDAVRALHGCNSHDITLDLAGVTFIDSRGLAALVMAHRQLAEERCGLRVVNPQRAVASALRMTGVSDYLAMPGGPSA
jgi:anti-sigma B factor antagonist